MFRVITHLEEPCFRFTFDECVFSRAAVSPRASCLWDGVRNACLQYNNCTHDFMCSETETCTPNHMNVTWGPLSPGTHCYGVLFMLEGVLAFASCFVTVLSCASTVDFRRLRNDDGGTQRMTPYELFWCLLPVLFISLFTCHIMAIGDAHGLGKLNSSYTWFMLEAYVSLAALVIGPLRKLIAAVSLNRRCIDAIGTVLHTVGIVAAMVSPVFASEAKDSRVLFLTLPFFVTAALRVAVVYHFASTYLRNENVRLAPQSFWITGGCFMCCSLVFITSQDPRIELLACFVNFWMLHLSGTVFMAKSDWFPNRFQAFGGFVIFLFVVCASWAQLSFSGATLTWKDKQPIAALYIFLTLSLADTVPLVGRVFTKPVEFANVLNSAGYTQL